MADTKAPLLGKQRMAASLREQAETIGSVDDPFARRSLRVAYHLRRYAAIYVVGAIGLLALAILPTVGGKSTVAAGGTGTGAYGGAGQGANASNDATAAAATGPAGGPGGSAASGGVGSGPAAGPAGSARGGPVGAVQAGTGVTVGGVPCHPGVSQLPFSQYAAPCVAKFAGNNGGATYNGVSGDTITIALRHNSDSQGANSVAVNALVLDAGGVDPTTNETYIKALVTYFNKNFELYGRHVNLVDFNGKGNGNDENLGNGQAAACADADNVANSLHAFSDINFQGPWESEPFSQCAAHYHVYIGQGALYYPESEYQSMDPYVWAITTNCTLGDQEAGEFIGKQMAPFPAKWAGMDGPINMQNTQRKFAIYVPNNAGYSGCAAGMIHDAETKYHMASNRFDEYQYALDISQAPQDSQKAITQFAADRDTTVVLLTDPIAPIFLSQAAHRQNYFPEWMLTGVALTDQDNWAQLWDQTVVRGRLFGLSQLGSSAKFLDPNGEVAQATKAAGVPLNVSSAVDYFELIWIYDQLQAAGPVLNPTNIKAGTHQLPQFGGSNSPNGTWNFGTAHTGIIDSRVIYWDGSKTSQLNNQPGTYVEVYNGRRFRLGEYNTEQPPVYP
jgi:hypothetical protein